MGDREILKGNRKNYLTILFLLSSCSIGEKFVDGGLKEILKDSSVPPKNTKKEVVRKSLRKECEFEFGRLECDERD